MTTQNIQHAVDMLSASFVRDMLDTALDPETRAFLMADLRTLLDHGSFADFAGFREGGSGTGFDYVDGRTVTVYNREDRYCATMGREDLGWLLTWLEELELASALEGQLATPSADPIRETVASTVFSLLNEDELEGDTLALAQSLSGIENPEPTAMGLTPVFMARDYMDLAALKAFFQEWIDRGHLDGLLSWLVDWTNQVMDDDYYCEHYDVDLGNQSLRLSDEGNDDDELNIDLFVNGAKVACHYTTSPGVEDLIPWLRDLRAATRPAPVIPDLPSAIASSPFVLSTTTGTITVTSDIGELPGTIEEKLEGIGFILAPEEPKVEEAVIEELPEVPQRPEGIPVSLLFLERMGEMLSLKEMMAIEGLPGTPDPTPDRFDAWIATHAAPLDEASFWGKMRGMRNYNILSLNGMVNSIVSNTLASLTPTYTPLAEAIENLHAEAKTTDAEFRAKTALFFDLVGS